MDLLYKEYLFLKGMFPTWNIKYHKTPEYIVIHIPELTENFYMYCYGTGFCAYLFEREYLVVHKYFKDIYRMKRDYPLQTCFYPKEDNNDTRQ